MMSWTRAGLLRRPFKTSTSFPERLSTCKLKIFGGFPLIVRTIMVLEIDQIHSYLLRYVLKYQFIKLPH